jgi:hypothetical protein
MTNYYTALSTDRSAPWKTGSRRAVQNTSVYRPERSITVTNFTHFTPVEIALKQFNEIHALTKYFFKIQLPASLLASFPCKPNTFSKRVKNVVTSKGIQVATECK